MRQAYGTNVMIALMLYTSSVFSAEAMTIASPQIDTHAIQPGEAYVTRFSGVIPSPDTGKMIIDLKSTVGSIIDIRAPGIPPKGHHWINEPQRVPINAGDAGQVFGIAIDDNDPANIYLTASAKFGLHRSKDNSQWMPGMWGKNAGPGTVYRLRAITGYQPEIFATIQLKTRQNSAAGLGNIAYDARHKQLFVSDLETGMIHRIDAKSGQDLGVFDHGLDGRSLFTDALSGKVESLPIVPFDSKSIANIDKCPTAFENTPDCWNIADFRRRVWGLGVLHDNTLGASRLYYAVWSNAPLGSADWPSSPEKQNSVWSIGLSKNGDFDIKDVRREFFIPELGTKPMSQQAISDIAFSVSGEMLIAENGILRNLGLDKDEPFSKPHQARALLYTLNQQGVWTLKGQHNVGNYDQSTERTIAELISSAGGVDFGYGYDSDGFIDLSLVDEFIWVTGDALCSPKGACFDLETDSFTDFDEVHGVQGAAKDQLITPLYLLSSNDPKPDTFNFVPTYMIDTDINILPDGSKSPVEAKRNDATKIGDVEIYTATLMIPPPGQVIPFHNVQFSAIHRKISSSAHDKRLSTPFHSRQGSHSRWGSHQRNYSHYRQGSHNMYRSHAKFGSHYRLDSHYRLWSHNRSFSHGKYGSHDRRASHLKYRSHQKPYSHYRQGSHNILRSHDRYGSHYRVDSHYRMWSHHRSQSHLKYGSHDRYASHLKKGSHLKQYSHKKMRSHDKRGSHLKTGSHHKDRSHLKQGSHNKDRSHLKQGSHNKRASHLKTGSHSKYESHRKEGSHNKRASHLKLGSHDKRASHFKIGSHDKYASHRKVGSHNKDRSHLKVGSHNRDRSHRKIGSHNRDRSHLKVGSHNRDRSHRKIGSHNRDRSHLKVGSHNRDRSHRKYGSHNRDRSHLKVGSHNRDRSHRKIGSHNRNASHQKYGSHKRKASHRKQGSHRKNASHRKYGSHGKKASHRRQGSHHKNASHRKYGSHGRKASHRKQGSHRKSASHRKYGSHGRNASHRRQGSHRKSASHRKYGSHSKNASHRRGGSHSKNASHRRGGSHNRHASHRRGGSHSKSATHRRGGSHNRHASHNRGGSHSKSASHNKGGSHNRSYSLEGIRQ